MSHKFSIHISKGLNALVFIGGYKKMTKKRHV